MENEIKEFIKTKRGKATYKTWLENYFDIIKAKPETYFQEKRNFDNDVLEFVESPRVTKWVPATKSYFRCIF